MTLWTRDVSKLGAQTDKSGATFWEEIVIQTFLELW